MKKLVVGNPGHSTTERRPSDTSGEFGNVPCAAVGLDRMGDQSRGCGFVEDEDAAAQLTVEALGATARVGRNLHINAAHERASSGGAR